MFLQSNPETQIAHHTHSFENIEKAIKCNIPTIVLIREPEHAIASSVIAHKKIMWMKRYFGILNFTTGFMSE